MTTQYFAAQGGEPTGPFTREELDARLATGELSPDDLVYHEGLSDWIPARDLPPEAAGGPPPLSEPPPTTGEVDTKIKSGTMKWVIRGVLLLLLIGAIVVAALETKAQTKWKKAFETADKLIDEPKGDTPKDIAKALGRMDYSDRKEPVLVHGKGYTEIYTWKGPIFRYELEVQYDGKPGALTAAALKTRRVR